MKNHSILHLFDPKDVETFVRQDGKYPFRRSHRASLKYRLDRPELYLDGGLFCENEPSWYRQRNQFHQRLLSIQQVAANIEKLDEVNHALIDQIDNCLEKNRNTIGNFQAIYMWALGSTLKLFLDLNVYKLEDELVRTLIQELHNSLTGTDGTEIKSNKWLKQPSKCPYYGMLEQSQEVLYRFVSEQVEQRKTESASNALYLSDWLFKDHLKQSDVISFIIDTLMAGLHTTSYTVANLLNHIANEKAIRDSLQKEIQEFLSVQESITKHHIDKLRSLRSCLKETMRLNPVLIGTGRLTTEKLVVRNYEITANIIVITQNQVISLNETLNFYEPNKFKPERWFHYRTCPHLTIWIWS
ncbi:hypothetical protein SUGI_1493250 [Cryptomeria japonica]|uniref:Cytochrome P450 n=1 Tax=Cryptomeria japonica TaxID=3369 RepID=A0AAD3RRV2_CRYJA|nr:uncharacterized protein LOC131872744 [Cryptomeria japonica]GLJ59123.1 hypothetical protein SUGI_1493250 [Cryptomeria japonica]